MIDISVDVKGDISTDIAGLRDQLPFATAVAINRTAEEVLAEGRREIKANFLVRVPGFDLPPVQLPEAWRATKTRQIATVNLGDSDGGSNSIGARRVQIFTKFEYGQPKVANDPGFPIAIPTRAIRPSPMALVPRSLYPKNLRLSPRLDAGGQIQPALRRGKVRGFAGETLTKRKRHELGMEGAGGTFTILDEQGRPIGIFQRTGAGRRDIRMIWAFRPEIHIPRRMDFAVQGTRIIEERFDPNFEGALDLAIRTAWK